MKNKRGFTLIELLAVIAVLSILIIIAVPNVLKLYNESKKKIFLEDAKSIYKSALLKISENTFNYDVDLKLISSETGDQKLDIENSNIKYCVSTDGEEVLYVKVTNGEYSIEYSGTNYDKLKIENITEGAIDLSKCKYIKPVTPNPCTYDGELVQGAEYKSEDGVYTYRYMQKGTSNSWQNITSDGWGVKLTDKNSTDAVDTKLCTSINDKPIVSMSSMFYQSKATSIDVSSFDTSNVTDMRGMFALSQATTITGLNKFNTSNVTDMQAMFNASQATSIDVSSFDTSNVTNMHAMFGTSYATTITGLNNFNTSNVTNMKYMFQNSQATTLDLSSFDTSKVTDMSYMFADSQATSLDLSNFDTSKVTSMSIMFFNSQATTITGLNNFNTSNVTDMSRMFSRSMATILDLSSFDTSNVTNMQSMFASSKVTSIDVSSKWSTAIVTDSNQMFYSTTNLVGGSGTRYSSSHTDKTYARVDDPINGKPGYFTYKAN